MTPAASSYVHIAPSNIQGVGVFVSKALFCGEIIATGIETSPVTGLPYVTDVGSKVNHSWTPTAKLVRTEPFRHEYQLQALRDLPPWTEITIDYRDTPSYILRPDSTWH